MRERERGRKTKKKKKWRANQHGTVKRQNKKKGKKKNERGSNNKHEHFPKKDKGKVTLINKGENRRIITQQIHSLLTFLPKLGRKLFFS